MSGDGVNICISVFFFQAEDGIRDRSVTGVQTCALSICCGGTAGSEPDPTPPTVAEAPKPPAASIPEPAVPPQPAPGPVVERSEERRVGKGCGIGRCPWC